MKRVSYLQIWDNCRMYNAPTHAVRIAGEKMSEIWERKWQSIDMETKFAEEAARQRAEDNVRCACLDVHAQKCIELYRGHEQAMLF